jgi:hypothetical protein
MPYGDELYGDIPYGDHGVGDEGTTPTPSTPNKVIAQSALGEVVRLYYDPQYPLGKICFDYAPEAEVTFHVRTEKPLLELSLLDTEIDLPLQYKEALTFNLAVRVSTEEDTTLSKLVYDIANISKTTLENLNANDRLRRQTKIEKVKLNEVFAI